MEDEGGFLEAMPAEELGWVVYYLVCEWAAESVGLVLLVVF